MEFNLFLCSQVTAAPCFACLFNYSSLFMQLAERLQPFVHYVNHNTVTCIAVSILRLNFGERLYFGGRQAENRWEAWRRVACSNLLLDGESRSRNRAGCPSASDGKPKPCFQHTLQSTSRLKGLAVFHRKHLQKTAEFIPRHFCQWAVKA